MRKIKPVVYVILIMLLFSGCTSDITNDDDTVLMAQIQGKWKLTGSYSDDQLAPTPISNGYEIEFKADKTFNSNEDNIYHTGTYTILKSLGANLRLIYSESFQSTQVYKYINAVDDQHIYLQASSPNPTPAGQAFLGGFVLTRIP